MMTAYKANDVVGADVESGPFGAGMSGEDSGF
jgi:hypothetical protein